MMNAEINKQMKLSQHLTSSSEAALSHSSKLDGLRLSPHFTLAELTKTSVKTKDGNIPSRVHIENLKRVCGWLERLRQRYNHQPIIINSGYRSPQVNKAVGGAQNSNHLTGCAVDIRCLGKEQAIRYATILLDIADESGEPFDELIIERSAKSIWVHFAVRPEGNRQKVDFLRK